MLGKVRFCFRVAIITRIVDLFSFTHSIIKSQEKAHIMTTKSRNIVIIVALLLIILALLLGTPLRAVDKGKASPSSSLPARLIILDAAAGWKLSGEGQAGPRPGAERQFLVVR